MTRAEQHRAAILYAIECGSFDYAETFPKSSKAVLFAEKKKEIQTVESYFGTWFEKQKKRLKASTYDGYRKIINYHLIPEFGEKKLDELTREVISDWLETLDCSNKRLANIQSVLRQALSDAVNKRLIKDNPLHNWTYRQQSKPKESEDIDPFTIEEQETIIKAFPSQVANMIKFAFWSGLRTSEVVALNWSDIDLVEGEIKVRRAMTQAAKGVAEDTKTRSGRRNIKILPPALDALNAQNQEYEENGSIRDKAIFLNPETKQRWEGDYPIRNIWRRALKKAGVRYRRPYQTRHTYASMMLSAGEHPMWVAKQMGHADWTITARIYARWMPQADPDAGGRAVEKFASKMLSLSCLSGAKTALNQPNSRLFYFLSG